MINENPSVPESTSPAPSRLKPFLTLRTTLILAIGFLVAGGLSVVATLEGLSLLEILVSAGTGFGGVVAFLNKVVE